MSRSIDLYFYGGLRQSHLTLLEIVRRLSLMKTVSSDWEGLSVSKANQATLTRLAGPFDRLCADDVEELVNQHSSQSPEYWYITTASLLSSSDLDSSANGQYFAIDITTSGPLCQQAGDINASRIAKISVRPHHLFQAEDEKIQEFRTDLLLYLSSMVISALTASLMHTYMPDFGYPWPVNSLMSYYQSDLECAKDMMRSLEYWRTTATSSVTDQSIIAELLQGFRSREESDFLLGSLNEILLSNVTITEDHVRSVRERGRFDIVDRPESGTRGFIILNYPNLFSPVVDKFFLQVLLTAISGN